MHSIENQLGYHFRDVGLLKVALTPPSAGLPIDNQRLEFLGDSVLHLCVSNLVYREHPKWDEGSLSKLRGLLVCADTLYQWAQDLGIKLEIGPRSPKNMEAVNSRNPLADSLEAVLAAVFLDVQINGGDAFGTVQAIVESRFLQEIQDAFIGIWKSRDSKTTLQERAAAMVLPRPIYKLINRFGPDHLPAFTVQVNLGELKANATSGTLKGAETEAARALLRLMEC
jgi:ribonuclease-3